MPKTARWPRLDQLLSNLGYCSRRSVQTWIHQERVTHKKGEPLSSEKRFNPDDLLIDGKELDHAKGLLVLFHKPAGYVCSHVETDGPSVYSFFPEQWLKRNPKFVSVGRLDKDTTGLLLLTDQHELVQRLTSPKKHVTKVYDFEFEGTLDPRALEIFASGKLILKGESKPCKPAKLELTGPQSGRLSLNEGRYHQVKRMVAAVGGTVSRLHRVSFGDFELGSLPEGQYKILAPGPAPC